MTSTNYESEMQANNAKDNCLEPSETGNYTVHTARVETCMSGRNNESPSFFHALHTGVTGHIFERH